MTVGIMLAVCAVVSVVLVFVGLWIESGGRPKKVPASGDLTDDELAELIHLTRARAMKNYPRRYPTEDRWNERALTELLEYASAHPHWARRDIRTYSQAGALMDRASRVDPVELRRRIRDLEREAGI